MVKNILRTKYHNHRDLEDFVQQALLKVYTVRHRIPEGEKRTSYIRRIVLNNTCDVLRKQKHEITLQNRGYEKVNEETRFCHKELFIEYPREFSDPFILNAVSETIAALSPTHRDVLLLRANDFEYSEIAQRLQISIGTVRSSLHYAKKKCAKSLAVHSS